MYVNISFVSKTITFYKTSDGKCPIQDFLDSLSGKAAQKVTWVLKLLEDLDVVPSSYFKKLTGTEEIWECRTAFGSNAYRIFCFFECTAGAGLTQEELARRLQTQKTAMTRIENRAAHFRVSTLERVSSALGKRLEVKI